MVLKVVSSATSGSNGTVTIIGGTANQINVSPNPITTTGNIALANITTAGTYGNASTVAQVVIDATGRVTSASNVAISIANSAVTGLGTMATQNANAVAITGGNIAVTYANASKHIATANIAASSNIGAFSYGNLSYTDIGIVASYANSANNSVQLVMQNSSSLSNASTDIAIVNDTGSAYIDVGIASSTYSGAGAFNKANGAYAYAGSTDLYLGTISSNAVHILANNSNTDAITVYANNAVSMSNVTVNNVTIASGTINVTTVNMTANTASNVTYTSATMQLVPAGYINFDLNGVLVKIPYYNA